MTGDFELTTSVKPDGGISAMVSYAGGRDLYTVSGSLVRGASERPDQEEHHAAHERILETLTTPNRFEGGNEMSVSLLED